MSDSDEVMGVDLEGGAYEEMDTETEERLLRESPDLNGKNDGEANGEVKVSCLELLKSDEWIHLDDPFKDVDDNLKVCAGNIPPEVGEDQLKFHFSTCYGPVMDVHLRSDSDGTGFAFIIFEEAKIAEKVMTNNRHYKINDKEMYIKSYASDEDQKKIFVTPLSKTEKEEVLTSALTTIFEQFGELVRVDWPLDHGKGRRRAFLLYKNIQGAITATNKENYMQEVEGAQVEAKMARKRIGTKEENQKKKDAVQEAKLQKDTTYKVARDLRIDGLTDAINPDELKSHFMRFGEIETIKWPKDIQQKHRDHAYILFTTMLAARKAIDFRKKQKINNIVVEVKFASPHGDKLNQQKLKQGPKPIIGPPRGMPVIGPSGGRPVIGPPGGNPGFMKGYQGSAPVDPLPPFFNPYVGSMNPEAQLDVQAFAAGFAEAMRRIRQVGSRVGKGPYFPPSPANGGGKMRGAVRGGPYQRGRGLVPVRGGRPPMRGGFGMRGFMRPY